MTTTATLLAGLRKLNFEIECDADDLQKAQDALDRKVDRREAIYHALHENAGRLKHRQEKISEETSRRLQRAAELDAKADGNSAERARQQRQAMDELQSEYDGLQAERESLAEQMAMV